MGKISRNSLLSYTKLSEAEKQRTAYERMISDMERVQNQREFDETRKIAERATKRSKYGRKIVYTKKVELAYVADGSTVYANDNEKGRKPEEKQPLKRGVTDFDLVLYAKGNPFQIIGVYEGLGRPILVRRIDLENYIGLNIKFIR